MAAKKIKKNAPSANGNRTSAQFSRGCTSPMTASGGRRPLTREQILAQQRNSNAMNKKAMAKRRKKKVDPNKKYRIEKQKRIKKGRDYFFVMRKFVCFVLFLLFTVNIALFAVSYLDILPAEVSKYTALYVEPDYTPAEERVSEEVDGEIVEYKDQSVSFSFIDPISGFIKKMTGKDLGLGESPKYDEMAEKVEVNKEDKLAFILMTYYPVAMLLFIIVALISMIKAFFAIFGQRVYRLFGLSAIIMAILAIIVVLGGVASNTPIEQKLDFSQLVPFLTGSILPVADASTAPTTAAGFGLLAMIVLPIIIVVLSLFAKKKVPYSIFD